MNREQRREAQKADRAGRDRAKHLRTAVEFLIGSADPTVTDATIFLPSGEELYLDAAALRAMSADDAGGRA